jgi:dipeptidyl aminopeptidase/acylaminoacyl peptidase
MMAEQLRKHGVSHKLVAIVGGEHGLAGADPEQIQDAFEAMKEFIVQHIEK